MKTLVISTYPPERCGVALFTAQAVQLLREAGEEVRILTWGKGQGDIHLGPVAPRGKRALELLRHCREADRVVLHYMPDFFIDDRSRWTQIESRLALTRILRSVRPLEVMVHEQPWYPPVEQMGPAGKLLWYLERRQFAAAPDLRFHNTPAIEVFMQRFRLPGTNAQVLPHGCHFRANYSGSRDEARAELGLDPTRLIFVSVGFISPRKGYELALEALSRIPEVDCEYYIVGTAHPGNGADDEQYIQRLQELSAGDARIRYLLDFVDDVAFDRWTRAADVVLIPSKAASSSSVLARCRLLGTPAITTAQPGLVAELGPGDQAIASAEELAAAIRRCRRADTLTAVG